MMYPWSLSSSSIMAAYTLSPGYLSERTLSEVGHATTQTMRMFLTSAPRLTHSSMALSMVPPVASMGSEISTR